MAVVKKTTKTQMIVGALVREATRGDLPGGKLQTIRQIAERFNTSTMTACKAVDILAQKGIVDKQHGRGLYIKRERLTKAVAIVIETTGLTLDSGVYYPKLLAELEAAFRKYRWACRYFINIDTEFGRHDFDFALSQGHIDAVVFASQWFFENRLPAVEAMNIPCIGIYRNGYLKHWVGCDYGSFIKLADEEVRRLGKKRVGCMILEPSDDWNDFGKRLHLDYIKIAEERFGPDMVVRIPDSSRSGRNAMKTLYTQKGIDGVVISHEVMARGAMVAMFELGLKSPEDMVMACVLPEGADTPDPMIEIRLPIREQAEKVAKLAVAVAGGREVENEQIFVRFLPVNPFI